MIIPRSDQVPTPPQGQQQVKLALNIINIAAFLALMQNGEGLIDKSPDYIMEKFARYALSPDPHAIDVGLDSTRRALVADWATKWLKKEIKVAQPS